MVSDDFAGIAAAGAGVFAQCFWVFVGFVVGGCIWTCNPFHAELGVERCSLYSSLPGPLQIVQRAEMWDGGGGILALQSLVPVHFGVDHKKVVRHVSHILSGVSRGRPWSCVLMVTF